jgi:Uma2 family endonuclease
MATITLPAEQRLFLSGVDWSTYDGLLHQLDGRHLRLTYLEGDLEIMTVSPEHERAKKLIARFLEALTEELDIPILSLGNTTYRREDAARGLEPDECWYLQHEALMRDKTEIDLATDPPPDLVIELEISRSVLDRLEIYAALGVPEVWRFDGQALHICVLDADGTYTETDRSPTFPKLPVDGLSQFFAQRGQIDETSLVKSFRAWVRAVMKVQ